MSEDNMKYGRDELLAREEAALQDIGGVLQAMDTMEEYERFAVVRGGKELFAFRVRGLDDGETEKCRTEATKYTRNRRMGRMAVPTDFNTAKFNSLLINLATHPADRGLLWDNKDLQERAQAVTAWQVVDKVLKAGEKGRVVDLIERLSGFGDDGGDTIDAIKNS